MDEAMSAVVCATARAALVQHLLEDAAAHEAGRVDASAGGSMPWSAPCRAVPRRGSRSSASR